MPLSREPIAVGYERLGVVLVARVCGVDDRLVRGLRRAQPNGAAIPDIDRADDHGDASPTGQAHLGMSTPPRFMTNLDVDDTVESRQVIC